MTSAAPPGRQFVERLAVVSLATEWLSTPWHHAAEIKGVGVDCAHLLIAVYGGLSLVHVPEIEYAPDWFLHGSTDLLREWVARYCVTVERPERGDIALYCYGRFASHAAIVVATDPLEVVHAFRDRGVVREEADINSALLVRLDSYWTLKRWVA